MSIEFESRGAIALITINRPDAMNALDDAHNQALSDAWLRYNETDDLRCAVITGAGDKAFSAGADLRQRIPSFSQAVRDGRRERWTVGGLTDEPHFGKPIIAAINGHCLAGGLELALACDIRVCVPAASLGLAEVKWAITPGAGGTQRLPRAVPLGWAMEMILTGDPIDADTALAIGLVNHVVPPDQLLDKAMELAGRIAARGPLAVRLARQAVLQGLSMGLAAGLNNERELFLRSLRSEDAAEGARSFAEKRPPAYRGR